jgi:DHA1 family tetracycline resistance protein-like MFS transporter
MVDSGAVCRSPARAASQGASFSVGSAYIADVTSAEDRAKGFGMIGMAFGIGFILGPMLGGILGDYRAELPFFAAAAFSLLNALYGLFVLPESLPKHLRTPFSLKKANAFSALKGLVELKGLGVFILAITLTNLAQFMMHSVWVRYTETRFLWTPKDNGVALFAVGMSAAIVQGGLLSLLIKKLGEVRLAKVGLLFAAMQFILMGLAPQGFYIYIILLVTILASAAGPALQAHVSRAVPAHKQGIAMGSLTSIGSITQVIAPFAGLSILSKFTHAPGALQTLQAGMPFFASAALQFLAYALAVWYFSRAQISSGSGGTKSIITG